MREQRESLREANANLTHYASTLEQLTVSRERNRLARELHDTLAHSLTAISVSLETAKWATVIERMDHQCFYFCGQCDRPPEKSYLVPEAFYRHPTIDAINEIVYTGTWGHRHEGRKLHPEVESKLKVWVVDKEPSTREIEIPAEYKTISRVVLASSASTREVSYSAEYSTISKTVLVNEAEVKEIDVPAQYATRIVQEIESAATTRVVDAVGGCGTVESIMEAMNDNSNTGILVLSSSFK